MKRVLILTMLLVLAAASVSFAASARWNALGREHRFILDTSNYSLYPARMLMFANAVWVIPNIPAGAGIPDNMMSGLLVKKDDFAWALHYNLPGAVGFGNLTAGLNGSGNANLIGLAADARPFPDVFLAKKMGDTTLGGRVVLGLVSSEPVADKTASGMSIDVAAGVTMPMGTGDMDLGVRVSTASFSDDSGAQKVESTGGLGVNVDARLMMDRGNGKMLVPVASVAFGSDATVDGATEVSSLAGDIGLGMTAKYGTSMLVSGALLGLDMETTTPPVGDEVKTTTITLTYLGGYEKPIFKWLVGRAGARGTLAMVSGDDNTVNGKSAMFAYDFGVRCMHKKALVDVLLDKAFLHRGPYILTGSGANWSGNVCLSYLFD